MRATIEHVLTDNAFAAIDALSARFANGVQAIIDLYEVPWSISRLGARSEYRFSPQRPPAASRTPPQTRSSRTTSMSTWQTAMS
jgi:glutamate-1-semialdehyde aminotransferase